MAVQQVMDKNGLKWENLSGITTDGAPAVVGKGAGLTALVSDKVHECIIAFCIRSDCALRISA